MSDIKSRDWMPHGGADAAAAQIGASPLYVRIIAQSAVAPDGTLVPQVRVDLIDDSANGARITSSVVGPHPDGALWQIAEAVAGVFVARLAVETPA